MLIKRTERLARRDGLAAALANQSGGTLDRRSFLRHSGLTAGALAAIGTLPLSSVRKAEAGPPPAAGGRQPGQLGEPDPGDHRGPGHVHVRAAQAADAGDLHVARPRSSVVGVRPLRWNV